MLSCPSRRQNSSPAPSGSRDRCLHFWRRCPRGAAGGVVKRPMTVFRAAPLGDRNRLRELRMNFEKYTDRARGFIQAAQSLALREGHQQFAPEHLLKVLLDDPEGLAAGLIDRSGSSSSTLSRCSGANCWCPSRRARLCADWTKPRARSVYFSKSMVSPSACPAARF